MVWVRSDRIETLIAGGIDASSCGSIALIAVDGRDDVGAGLALDRQDDRRAAGSYQPASRLFSGPSTAWPMSRMRTGEPF